MALLLFTACAALVVVTAEKPDGTCGYQCTVDSECGGCGTAGKCSCPGGPRLYSATECTCVSAPESAPADAYNVADTAWPAQWTADVDSWCYGSWDAKVTTASGKFFYDRTLGTTRADWTPYTNGHDAKQVWIVKDGKSHYYVKMGPICLDIPIGDPGQNKAPVGIEEPDWIKRCDEAGMATYVGREQVNVNGKDEWTDHWACHIQYDKVNQTINFQNWNSLGLGSVPKGLPVRVTGGNSQPNPTMGSPRLNSVWYRNFVSGPNATKPEDFIVPNFGLCVPVAKHELTSFFGHSVQNEHASSPDFHRRAHYLVHATPSKRDLTRAKQPKPSRSFLGDSFGDAMQKLNRALARERGLQTKACSNFSVDSLHDMQRALFDARTPALDSVYHVAGDTRKMAHRSLAELQTEQRNHVDIAAAQPALAEKVRDGICHEMVMWYVHHLSASAREEIKERLVLPLLPTFQHPKPLGSVDAASQQVHSRYGEQVSCAVCHVAGGQSTESEIIAV